MGLGKGKGKAAPAPKPEPGPRTRVTSQRVTGTLTEWKGLMGWIVPDQKISHPQASMKKGRIYCTQEDVEAEIAGPGATVSFFVYADGTGLGAMHVRPAAGGRGVQRLVQKPAGKASGKGFGEQGYYAAKPTAKGDVKWTPARAAKGAGKGSEKPGGPKEPKKPPKEQPPPDKTAREVLDGMPVAGIVQRVNGKVALVKPDEPVEHELASKRGGLLYLHFSDMEDSDEEPLVGAQVIFFIYVDDHGLGAERCTIVEQGTGKVGGGDGDEEETSANTTVKKNNLKKKKNRTKSKANAEGKGEPKEPKEKGPSGPDLPRERITTEPVTGELLVWKQKWGWIKPSEPIDHPGAQAKHEGKIYVHEKDIEGEPDMEAGKQFTFHVFVDASGLGAEECSAC